MLHLKDKTRDKWKDPGRHIEKYYVASAYDGRTDMIEVLDSLDLFYRESRDIWTTYSSRYSWIHIGEFVSERAAKQHIKMLRKQGKLEKQYIAQIRTPNKD